MTSNNSFSINFWRLQKDLASRRLWVIIFVTLPLVLAYPVMLGLQLASRHRLYGRTVLPVSGLTREAARYIANEGLAVVLFSLMAAFLAIQGFSYLFHKDRTDFFESLPFPRKSRFVLVFTNGILVFLCTYLLSMLLTVVVCAAYRADLKVLLPVAGVSVLRFFVFFCAMYAVFTAGVMLAGSVFYAMMLACFLLLAPLVYEGMIISYAESFFLTYAGKTEIRLWLNPVYNLLKKTNVTGYTGNDLYRSAAETVSFDAGLFADRFADALPHLLLTIACFVIAAAASYLLYKKRRAEWAGVTICLKRVHVFVKLVTAIGTALVIALGIQSTFFYDEMKGGGAVTAARMVVILVCTALVAALFLEGMYRRSVRGAFKDLRHLPVACAVPVLFFLVFYLDITGFDRYVPDTGSVTSFAVSIETSGDGFMPWNYDTDDPETPRMGREEYIRKNMYLTDVEAAAALMEQSGALVKQMRTGGGVSETCVNGIMYFRTANGSEKARRICIPVRTDDELLHRVFDTPEYVQCVFQVYHDAPLKKRMTARAMMSFQSDAKSSEKNARGTFGNSTFYEAFAEAYRKDLADYSVIRERDEIAVGIVRLFDAEGDEMIREFSAMYAYAELDYSFPVYGDYENTIAFLKEADMYHGTPVSYEGAADGKDLQTDVTVAARVWKYDTVDVEYGPDGTGYTVSTSAEDGKLYHGDEALEIIAHSVNNRYISGWFDRDTLLDQNYAIDIEVSETNGNAASGMYTDPGYYLSTGRTFIRGEVPDFVK